MPAPDGGLVHHVVVIQGRQVGELDRHRGRHYPLVLRVAELGGQQHQGGAEPLATRIDEVPGCLREQLMLGARRIPQALLDQRQAVDDIGCQRRIGQLHGHHSDHSGSLDLAARWRTGGGREIRNATPTISARQSNRDMPAMSAADTSGLAAARPVSAQTAGWRHGGRG